MACTCVPQPDDVPLLLRNLTSDDIRVLCPFDIYCGDYKRMVHGYHQRTGTFHITWSALSVQEKILAIEDQPRRVRLQRTFDFLMGKADSSYGKFIRLFKTITGAINSSRASGCSPNAALRQKSFSATYWQWQHLYLLDAVRQYGFPSFFPTISPYEWTFPWSRFIQKIREEHCLEPTDLPLLETLHVAHVLKQVAQGYLAGANSNRWHQHVFNNQEHPGQSNLLTYFYRMEFQSRGTLHLHMLVWVKDLSLIRANLLHASIPWGNPNDAFLVADTKSSSSCLPLPGTRFFLGAS